MRTSRKLTQALLAMCALVMMASAAFAADPGTPFPATSEVSDQKAGSILFYVIYTSSTTSPNTQNTALHITNTNTTEGAFVHLFFIASNCNVADLYLCLTRNQTATTTAFDSDPGITGYAVAIAVNGINGCPTSFNYLIGDLFIKTSTGHSANLGAEAFSALYDGDLPGCDGTTGTATLRFNGIGGVNPATAGYNRAPRVLAVASVPSFVDSNDTRIVLIRVGGDLLAGPRNVGTIFGITYNDSEQGFSWSISVGCQLFARLTNDFPRTVPRFTDIIPQNQTGWIKLWSTEPTPRGILGGVELQPECGDVIDCVHRRAQPAQADADD